MVERGFEVGQKNLPFFLRDIEVDVGIVHRFAGVFLGTTRCPANHLGYQVFEASAGNTVMGFVDFRVGVETRVVHDTIDEVVDHGGNRVDAPPGVRKENQYFRRNFRSSRGCLGLWKDSLGKVKGAGF